MSAPSGIASGLKQPIAQHQGGPKGTNFAAILKPSLVLDNSCLVLLFNEGFHNTRIVYLGGLWVMIEMNSSVPLNAWSRSTFQKIGSKWGELVILEDGYEDLFARKRICIIPPYGETSWESFQAYSKKEDLCLRKTSAVKANEEANNLNLGDENDSEVVSDTYFGDNGEDQGVEHHQCSRVMEDTVPADVYSSPVGSKPIHGSANVCLDKNLSDQHRPDIALREIDQGGVSDEILLSRMELTKQMQDINQKCVMVDREWVDDGLISVKKNISVSSLSALILFTSKTRVLSHCRLNFLGSTLSVSPPADNRYSDLEKPGPSRYVLVVEYVSFKAALLLLLKFVNCFTFLTTRLSEKFRIPIPITEHIISLQSVRSFVDLARLLNNDPPLLSVGQQKQQAMFFKVEFWPKLTLVRYGLHMFFVTNEVLLSEFQFHCGMANSRSLLWEENLWLGRIHPIFFSFLPRGCSYFFPRLYVRWRREYVYSLEIPVLDSYRAWLGVDFNFIRLRAPRLKGPRRRFLCVLEVLVEFVPSNHSSLSYLASKNPLQKTFVLRLMLFISFLSFE
ncbi:hypothetical protein Tco_0008726 [Tanacetum coccineum]